MFEALAFYKYQLLLGTLMGGAAAALGVFVLLQRMTFFGITLSQAATCAVAAALVMEIHNEAVTLGLTAVMMIPFLILKQRRPPNLEALLAFGFVFFSSAAHMLLSFSGSVQSHLVTAYFGNIVTADPHEWTHTWIYATVVLGALALMYRPLLAVSFDRDHATLSGIRTRWVDGIYFLLLSLVLGIAITHMGSFF
ncbi:MAG: metal ABC transporter permease, partial [Spirochaetia bacterium]|nr:metal ABC transporter permease [Spirochaetia bacterium]